MINHVLIERQTDGETHARVLATRETANHTTTRWLSMFAAGESRFLPPTRTVLYLHSSRLRRGLSAVVCVLV